MRCANPRCQTERAEGSRFCAEHRDQLARFAAEIEEGKGARLRSPESARQRRELLKHCQAPDCLEKVVPRESYCAYHLERIDHALEN